MSNTRSKFDDIRHCFVVRFGDYRCRRRTLLQRRLSTSPYLSAIRRTSSCWLCASIGPRTVQAERTTKQRSRFESFSFTRKPLPAHCKPESLGLSILQSLDAIDKRRKPLTSYSRCLIEGRLANHYATTRGRDALQSPRGYPVMSTSLIRNCPQKARIRLVARISPPRSAVASTTYKTTFAAAPYSSDEFPSADGNPTAQAQQEFTVAGNGSHTTCVTTFEISTPSTLGPFQNKHIRVGVVQPDDVGVAANIDFFSFWLEPIG